MEILVSFLLSFLIKRCEVDKSLVKTVSTNKYIMEVVIRINYYKHIC